MNTNAPIPRWTPADEYQLRQLQERREQRARALSNRVEAVADDIHVHNMRSTELAQGLVERADEVCRVLLPFLKGPHRALILPLGDQLPEDPSKTMHLREWSAGAILDCLVADGWIDEDDLKARTERVDGQGNTLSVRETISVHLNVATIEWKSGAIRGGFIIVRVPPGEGEF